MSGAELCLCVCWVLRPCTSNTGLWARAKGLAEDVPMTSRLWENVDTSWQVANKIGTVQKHA